MVRPQPLGRYPNPDAANGGFLNVDSHITDTQITSSALEYGRHKLKR